MKNLFLIFFLFSTTSSISWSAEWKYSVVFDKMTDKRTIVEVEIEGKTTNDSAQTLIKFVPRFDKGRRIRILINGAGLRCKQLEECKILTRFDSNSAVEIIYIVDSSGDDYAELIPKNESDFIDKMQKSSVLLMRPLWKKLNDSEIIEFKFSRPIDFNKLR
jgi:hypothetical protein